MTNVYIQLKKKISVSTMSHIQLKDIGEIATMAEEKEAIEEITLYQLTPKDRSAIVLNGFMIIKYLNKQYPHLIFELIGPTETIIDMRETQNKPSIIVAAFVWLLLFIGTAMTIINFHHDVNMQEAHQKIHYIFTGEEETYPLWIQIPYSLGLGVGMLLFFNHWFRKRFNKEPSPLEVELYNYQQNIDDFIKHKNETDSDHDHLHH